MKDVTQTTPAKKADAPKNGKLGFFKRMGRAIKETFAELKKVTWPTFGDTMKQLGAVIAVVALFLIVLTVFDLVLGAGFDQFKKALGDSVLLNLITKIL